MFADGVIESSSTTGTGTYTLAGAAFSALSFAQGMPAGGTTAFFAQTADKSKWEMGYGVLTIGPPRTLTRATILKSSNAGAAIDWQPTDVYYVFSIASADVLAGVIAGNLADTTRPWWLRAGGRWWNDAAGLAVSWIDNLYNGAADVRTGIYDAVKALYFPDNRRPSTAVGAASKVFAAADIGGGFTFNTTAAARTATLPAGSTVKDGYQLELKGLSTANGIVLTPDAGDGIDGGADGVNKTIPGGVLITIRWDVAADQWLTNYVAPVVAPNTAGRRQTVSTGPANSSGVPTFMPATPVAALTFTTQNVSGTAPFIASAANGWSATTGLPVDLVGRSTSNLNWNNALANNNTSYLYVLVNADGSLTTGSTTLEPIYQRSGTPSTTNNQFTFNRADMKGYLGNGATAPQVNLVFVGEAATSGGSITSLLAYTYNGEFETAFSASLPAGGGAATSIAHNLGAVPDHCRIVAECTTADNGYSLGERIGSDSGLMCATTVGYLVPLAAKRNDVRFNTPGGGNDWYAVNPTTGAGGALTRSSWKWKLVARLER